MTLTNAVKQRIINLAASQGIKSSFLNGKCSSITLTTLLHICEGCNITLRDFFDDDLFKDISESIPVVED